jgi:hypothetical protein
MEFRFPFAHTTDTVSNVESALRQNADGSTTAIVGTIDWVSNIVGGKGCNCKDEQPEGDF